MGRFFLMDMAIPAAAHIIKPVIKSAGTMATSVSDECIAIRGPYHLGKRRYREYRVFA